MEENRSFEQILENDYHVILEDNRRDESIKLAAEKYAKYWQSQNSTDMSDEAIKELAERIYWVIDEEVFDYDNYDRREYIKGIEDERKAFIKGYKAALQQQTNAAGVWIKEINKEEGKIILENKSGDTYTVKSKSDELNDFLFNLNK